MISFWVAVLALMLASPFAAAEPVSVVKVLNFSCSVCRASEVLDADIKRAAQEEGGKFAYAVMPVSLDNTYRELGYYAARDMYQEVAARESLYKGSQDMGLSFSDPAQVAIWLQDDAGLSGAEVSQGMAGEPAKAALTRALRLVAQGSVQRYPTYLILYQGKVVATIAPNAEGLFSLKSRVLSEISKPRAQSKESRSDR